MIKQMIIACELVEKATSVKEMGIPTDKIGKLALILIAIALPAFFLFACISLKPMEGISTEVNTTIETGSDVCLGFNESTCGALIKEKRTLSTGYVCTGAKGPSDYKSCYPDIRYGYLGPTCSASPSCHFVSSNPIEIGRLGFSEYCNSACSKTTSLPDVECKLVGGICRAEIVSNPTTVCKSDANAYNLPIDQWSCRKESSSYVMPYPGLSNSTVLSISRDCTTMGFAPFFKDITIYASVPNLAVANISLSCGLEANCPVSSKDPATGTNIESRIKDLNITVTGCGTTLIKRDLSPDLRTGYCSLATNPAWYGGNFNCAIGFLQDSPDKSSKIGAMTYMIMGSVLGPCGCTGVKSCEFKLKCNAAATHATTWKCEKTDRSAIYQFTDCQAPSSFSTFQGGEMYLQTGIPYSELSNIMTGYYNGSEQTKQIPFFMLGQGSTF